VGAHSCNQTSVFCCPRNIGIIFGLAVIAQRSSAISGADRFGFKFSRQRQDVFVSLDKIRKSDVTLTRNECVTRLLRSVDAI
jgi:hypothetical protein